MKVREFLFVGVVLLAACGGGGGDDGSSADLSINKGKPPATGNSSPFLFVADGDNAADYKIDPQTGALTPAGGPVAIGKIANHIAVDPRGKFAYVDTVIDGVLTYSINATTGDLIAVDSTGVPGGRDSIVMHPSGKFVYVVGIPSGSFLTSAVTGYLVNSQTGKLTPIDMPPLAVAGMDPITSFAIAPHGKFAYMTTFDKKVVTLNIDQTTGVLSVATGIPAVDGGTFPTAITISADGKFLFFVRRAGTPTVVALTVNAATGALTQISEAPVAGGEQPLWMIVEPNNKFVYAAASITGILTYAFDQKSGILASMGAPIAIPDRGAAVALAKDPSGKFAYVGSLYRDDINNTTTNSIWTAKIDSDTGAFTFSGQPVLLADCCFRVTNPFMITANVTK